MNVLFHLAFPVHDVEKARAFYVDQLGCQLGRESEHALIMGLGSHQIVAHKVDFLPEEQQGIYPRHFGLIFLSKEEFNLFMQRLNDKEVTYHVPLKARFPKTPIEHQSFFLKDPSNNLLEFKCYSSQSAILGEKEFNKIGENT